MNDFIEAVKNWNILKDEYVAASLGKPKSNSKVAPRAELLMTIPENRVEEFKAIAKRMRLEEDAKFKGDIDDQKRRIAIEFEKTNPPPAARHYQ